MSFDLTENLVLTDLPASLRDVAVLVGLPATLKIVKCFGGRISLYVPHDIEPDHPIAAAIGIVAAKKLASHYGGDYLRNIPRCVNGLRRMRDDKIHALRKAGASAARLSALFELTERHIWEILADRGDGDDDKQSRLF